MERLDDPIPTRTELGSTSSDAALLAACADGDRNAWAELVHRYQDLVYSTARQTGLAPEDCADVFQEAFLELLRSAARIRQPKALPGWLMVATRRIAYKTAIQRRRMIPELSSALVDPESLPDSIIEAAEKRNRVEQGLSQLDERCAQLLRALFFDLRGLTYDEIADRLSIPRGSIGPNRSRCLERLKSILRSRP
ncbi:MAG: sigma-70 family RNA polymerase sigma factor [Candidatus Eisenbacteria bacterium]